VRWWFEAIRPTIGFQSRHGFERSGQNVRHSQLSLWLIFPNCLFEHRERLLFPPPLERDTFGPALSPAELTKRIHSVQTEPVHAISKGQTDKLQILRLSREGNGNFLSLTALFRCSIAFVFSSFPLQPSVFQLPPNLCAI
jgi:hypothetical protein